MTDLIELALGDDSAVVSTSGAALLDYTVGDRPVVVQMSAFDGAVLAPWPNRIADGRYDFNGRSHQLPITEVSRETSLHGLVAETAWKVSQRNDASVRLETDISGPPGYPFELSLEVTYALVEREDEGECANEYEGSGELRILAVARNIGHETVPFGFGFHPWIHPGAERVDQAQLLVPAETWFETDDRLIPQTIRHFDTGSYIPADHGPEEASCVLCKDFRALRTLGPAILDDAFGTPQRGDDGWSRVRLRGADDRTVTIGMDESFRAWQLCTGDELDQPLRRSAIAIEPMTCPPNAFASGLDFDVIEAQGELSAEWTVSLR
ncbi:aldose 1-epimerase family protein [Brevibacterium aurantiacum]|uniref:Aldose 1-epimerase family protein n=1 Tax=Brevibacterium aurantiacum TaxID=273384 RepID=A0A556CF07_BREAU|nr:aldose 1-epimerase family protein [Brevibacterium aurantiacum]TSI16013.1 aldose 1-epimerase family protein [Brevibacterium aurantiacum]